MADKKEKENVEESLDQIAEAVEEKAEEIEEQVVDAAEGVADAAENLVEKAEQAAEDMANEIEDQVDCACECGEPAEVEYNNVNDRKFDDLVNEAKTYVSDAVNSIPTDEIEEGAREVVENVKEEAVKAGGAFKEGLLNHGIDIDVLGSKLQEDFSELAGVVANGIAKGASAVAGAVETAAKSVREKAEESGEGAEPYEPIFDEDGNRVVTVDPDDEDRPIKY